MGLSRQEEFILFTLGRCYEEADRRFAGKPLCMALSKVAFIDLARQAGMVQKGERALYKNLENLEGKRLISYAEKSLRLNQRGVKHYERLVRSVGPYVEVSRVIREQDVLRFARMQVKLK
ncbi:hypothetical protein HY489_03395 [Candidatus Woesearchaeota archaeon]|nr:hypothetical protein [Candidatus Woesearchaeota archaeon]